MDKIQRLSSSLLIVFKVLIGVVPALLIFEWGMLLTDITNMPAILNFFSLLNRVIQTPEGAIALTSVAWTPWTILMGFCADAIGVLPFFTSLFFLQTLFTHYKKGDVFTQENARIYWFLGLIFLIDALLFQSLSETLMVLAATYTNPPGHRYLSIGFGTSNLSSLFYGTLVMVVSWVMGAATHLHDEQKFTV